MQEPDLRIKLPSKLIPFVNSKYRYNVLAGGRGGAKSWGVADILVIRGYQEPLLILCTREIQNSIKDSVHKLLSDTIERRGLSSFYKVQKDSITGRNGTKFIFKGLHMNIAEIKSTEGIDICWLEEANGVRQYSLDILIPTVRKEGSQFFITYNPEDDNDPVHKNFFLTERDDVLKTFINYWDNPFFPDVLRKEMEWDKANDTDKYLHVWEGNPLTISEAQIFYGKWRVDSFEAPEGTTFYYGCDWGFAKDPACMVRCFIDWDKRILYIDYEAYGIGVELDELAELFDSIPQSREFRVNADPSRPDTISYMKKQGFNIKGADASKGSIKDGIAFIKSFKEIVVHARCKHMQDEFKLYKYKVDKITGDILPIIVDKHNHLNDSLRYSVRDLSKKKFEFVEITADGLQTPEKQIEKKVQSFNEVLEQLSNKQSKNTHGMIIR